MHTIEEIRAEYDRLDRLLGIDTQAVKIAFSPRAVYQFGCCRYEKRKGRFVPVNILIASFLQNEDAAFWDTVRHEYAHAAAAVLTGKNHGHDQVWKKICRAIGTDPQRLAKSCAGQEEKKKAHIRYRIICRTCGKEYHRTRRGKFVDAVIASQDKPTAYRCSCGGQVFICRINP